MWIYLQFLESSALKMPVKMPAHKDGFRIIHPSRIETARPKDGWMGLWLRPWFQILVIHLIAKTNITNKIRDVTQFWFILLIYFFVSKWFCSLWTSAALCMYKLIEYNWLKYFSLTCSFLLSVFGYRVVFQASKSKNYRSTNCLKRRVSNSKTQHLFCESNYFFTFSKKTFCHKLWYYWYTSKIS